MAPVSRPTHLLETTLFAIGYGVLRTLIILVIVASFFHLDLSGANIPGVDPPFLAEHDRQGVPLRRT